ncbi:glycosyltransferase family 2 protein [Adhaeribacter radiodurans]|uniref:Glycosyltransferase n=1 Tax=Adhaeribacter radiodurans TaxID=2745197 RepID=A0A7L7L3Q3_9BACT|nr:glycosyltransferase [Adhaeribacter radiodurans]QMU27451.1 glycosyltransferase [Adhaeribacter radiodurans]
MVRPKISVLMPVYNAAAYLEESIGSILNQTFTEFEFLILDDGSTDGSLNIIQSFSDPRIRFYKNKKNVGISATLNKGIELARTDLIARMDADDVSYPNRLQKQYDFIQAHPEGVIFTCWAAEVNENRKLIKIEHFNPEYYYFNMTFSNWIYHPTMVYRREAVLTVGKYSVPYSEDYELVWQLMRKYKAFHQPEVLLDYRINEQSLSNHAKKNEYKAAFLQQVRRNIQFYLDDTPINVEDWQLEYLSNDFVATLKEKNIQSVIYCIELLDSITKKIFEKENINRVPANIKPAAKIKRDYLIFQFYIISGFYKGIVMLWKTSSWGLMKKIFFLKLKKCIP